MRSTLIGIALAVVSCALSLRADAKDVEVTPSPQCVTCPKIMLHARLAKILKISNCDGASGMTCQLQFTPSAVLPSRIKVQQLDAHGHILATKFLPYPDLKAGERGRATFPIGSATTIILVGEWNGAWQDVY